MTGKALLDNGAFLCANDSSDPARQELATSTEALPDGAPYGLVTIRNPFRTT